MTHTFTFDEDKHEYRIDGRRVPSVTEILNDVLPLSYSADEWQLARGRVVHAAAAMIVKGEPFTLDLSGQTAEDRASIEGRIEAVRKFVAEVDPVAHCVEHPLYSVQRQYAGTLDLFATAYGTGCIFDYKGGLDSRVKYQLCFYAMLLKEQMGLRAKIGQAVEIHDDGTYALSVLYRIDDVRLQGVRLQSQCNAMLTSYNIRRECGIKTRKE